jgi:hypothetical protein
MDRPISTRTHGVIDYAWATAAGSLPKMMNGATETARLVRSAGAAAGVNSMVTNYEAGILRVLPMKGHLLFDFVMSAVLMMSPFFLPRAERRFAAIPVALGAVGLLTSLLTETTSPVESFEGFSPSRELSEAVADPDIARSPHLRVHLE